MRPERAMSYRLVAIVAVVAAIALLAASDLFPPFEPDRLQDSIVNLAPHRHAWYGLPITVMAFVLLGLILVPVLLLIAATGIAFGPWLGPVYAMAGCLASASVGFGIGRWTGLARVQRLGGRRVAHIHRMLERNGTLAVFLLRKVPAPFLLSNVVAGASRVRYRDFVVGTVLGMAVLVVALAGFGGQLSNLLDDPSWQSVGLAAAVLGVPLMVAWFVNRQLRRRHHLARA